MRFILTALLLLLTFGTGGIASAETLTQEPDAAVPLNDDPNKLAETKEVQAQESTPLQELKQTNITEPTQQPEPVVQPKNIPSYQQTRAESAIGWVVGVLLYGVSFFIYVTAPPLRRFTISTPFDIGCENGLSESEQAVKWKKQWSEFGLLLVSVSWYYCCHDQDSAGILNAFIAAFLTFFWAWLIVVVGRLLAGWRTKCPKCNNVFARKCVSKHKEPTGTRHVSSQAYNNPGYTVEYGVKHFDYLCAVCSHEWRVTKRYENNK